MLDGEVAGVRWYWLETVSTLSHEEAEVIAQRVVSRFAQQNGMGLGDIEALREIVAAALHACFLIP